MEENQDQEEKSVKECEKQNSEDYKWWEHRDYIKEIKDARKYMREQDEKYKKEFEAKNPRLKDQNTSENNQEQHYDKPGTMETITAIILYVIVMVVGTVFTERIYVYAGATMALICFLCRHKLDKRKKK